VKSGKQSTDAQRAARIAAIRAQIAQGTYETADKLDRAVDALLDRLASGGEDAAATTGRPPPRPK
jgi:anti-sigma28 factor (negative regulator of flagellin synthesis)